MQARAAIASEPVIRCRGLGKAYLLYEHPSDRLKEFVLRRSFSDEHWAIRDLDLEVRQGETLGIIGRNGSGKSTLLQMICGTLTPSCGDIAVNGRVAALLELGAGFNPDFTGRENVELSASVLGLTSKQIAERVPAIEAFAGIGHFIDLPVRQYSSGMYARLAFAVCAHVDADVLVIDEILAVGDAVFQQKCLRYLHRFRQRGTLLFVSHEESTVLSLCDRAVWLERGIVRAQGPSQDVCRQYRAGVTDGSGDGAIIPHDGAAAVTAPIKRDTRWANANPIEVFDFDPDAPWHGSGGAAIEHAGLYTPEGEKLLWTQGGDEVELRIACRADRLLTQPIVGYILRNRLGLNIFGNNTFPAYKDAPPVIETNGTFTVTFRFQLPYLPAGDYSMTTAITEGTQADHVHLHWIEGAVTMRVIDSPIRRGQFGIAMSEIRIDRTRDGPLPKPRS